MGFYSDAIKSIIKEWKDEAKVKGTVLYKLHSKKNEYDDSDMELIICTNRPGPMIGMHGQLVEKYRAKINKAFITPHKVMIKFVETEGMVI
jgi:ribosomal protein S3